VESWFGTPPLAAFEPEASTAVYQFPGVGKLVAARLDPFCIQLHGIFTPVVIRFKNITSRNQYINYHILALNELIANRE
jgi:hypothetical protein